MAPPYANNAISHLYATPQQESSYKYQGTVPDGPPYGQGSNRAYANNQYGPAPQSISSLVGLSGQNTSASQRFQRQMVQQNSVGNPYSLENP
jgi:hypothetical protein